MKKPSPHFWVALASAMAVLVVAVADLRGASSGDLATVHQRVDELSGSGGCDECHGGWFQSMSEACLDCHDTIQAHLDQGIGLHGSIDGTQAQACSLCHSEHHGSAFQPTNVQSFVLAVSAKPEDFDHSVIGWELGGAHLELGCVECHEHAEAAPLGEGQRRFIGLDRDCASCHEDPHEGALARMSCTECHVQESFDELHFADHDELLHLRGGHAELDCRGCHEQGEQHSLEALSAGRVKRARDCMACHESPHAEPFLSGVAEFFSSVEGSSCLSCHREEHPTFRAEELTLTPEEHAFSGFPLTTPHAKTQCNECHVPEGATFADRYPQRTAEDCAACHQDPHGGQFAEGPFAEQGCIACHERERFAPHAFDREKHAKSGMKLYGAHLKADCNACHIVPESHGEGPEEPRLFHGTDSSCDDCHTDAHGGYFDRALSKVGRKRHGDCAHCHRSTRFDAVAADTFDHAAWTGFALTGSHAQGDCETCHVPVAEPDRHGRRFGRVEDLFGIQEGCESCHADPHDGRFDLAQLPRDVNGRAGCARCHETTSFRSLTEEFAHGAWTGFELQGGHAEAGCSACHAPMRSEPMLLASGARLAGRSFAPAPGSSCESCHVGPHGDQFDTGIPVSCDSCHQGAESFSNLRFHHDRDTRFRLGQAHRDLDCSACHESQVQNGVEFVRYRGLGRECTDCHGVHKDQLKVGRGGGG